MGDRLKDMTRTSPERGWYSWHIDLGVADEIIYQHRDKCINKHDTYRCNYEPQHAPLEEEIRHLVSFTSLMTRPLCLTRSRHSLDVL